MKPFGIIVVASFCILFFASAHEVAHLDGLQGRALIDEDATRLLIGAGLLGSLAFAKGYFLANQNNRVQRPKVHLPPGVHVGYNPGFPQIYRTLVHPYRLNHIGPVHQPLQATSIYGFHKHVQSTFSPYPINTFKRYYPPAYLNNRVTPGWRNIYRR